MANSLSPIIHTPAAAALALSASQLKLVKETVAKDCNPQEFDLFMEFSRSMGLNPFRRQILPMVFNKGNANKRRMTMIVTRDGLRVIASRCGNYRPASEPAKIVFDPSLKGPGNPKGILSVSVTLWQRDVDGTWWPVIGEAYWDEFAPLKYGPDAYEDTGETWPDGNPKMRLKPGAVPTVLDADGNWPKMPIVMITKCAEMQALRAGWPEQFSNVYAEEEMDRARVIDAMASEIVANEEQIRREALISKVPSLTVGFDPNKALESVPVDGFYDAVMSWTRGKDGPAVLSFVERNRHPLREYWAKSPGDALALKTELERLSKLPPHKVEEKTAEAA